MMGHHGRVAAEILRLPLRRGLFFVLGQRLSLDIIHHMLLQGDPCRLRGACAKSVPKKVGLIASMWIWRAMPHWALWRREGPHAADAHAGARSSRCRSTGPRSWSPSPRPSSLSMGSIIWSSTTTGNRPPVLQLHPRRDTGKSRPLALRRAGGRCERGACAPCSMLGRWRPRAEPERHLTALRFTFVASIAQPPPVARKWASPSAVTVSPTFKPSFAKPSGLTWMKSPVSST